MENRTFGSPVRWGLGPGPAELYSVDGAIGAIDVWLGCAPNRSATEGERKWMLALRDILCDLPPDPCEAEMESAQMAIEGMVEYSTCPAAEALRMSTFIPVRRAA